MDSGVFEARNLRYSQARLGYADVDEGFDFKAITPESPVRTLCWSYGVEGKNWNVRTPEDVKSITQVGIMSLVTSIEQNTEKYVGKLTEAGNVCPAAPLCESSALGKICAFEEYIHELGDFAWISRAVRVNHGYDVTRCRRKTTRKSVALAATILHNYPNIGP